MFIQHNDIPTKNGSIVCSIPNSKFSNIRFTVGRVSFHEINNELKVSFTYNVVSGIIWFWDRKRFIKEVGDNLIEEINYRLNNGEIIFSGGDGLAEYE